MYWIYTLTTNFKLFVHAHIIYCTDTPYLCAIHTLNIRIDTSSYLGRYVQSGPFEFESNHIRNIKL